MRHIRAISLDLDDTLWEIEPVIKRAEAALWSWLDEHYPRIRKHWTPQALIELRMAITSEHPERAHDFRFLRKRVLSIVATKAGYSDELVDPAFSVFDKHRNTVDLYPDVEAALHWFSAHFTVIATTNGNANLNRIGIGRYFDHTVTSVAAGAPKPAAAVFDMVAAIAGVSHREVLHVGDHPETDVAGGLSAGMTTVWVNRKDTAWKEADYQPDVEVADLAALRKLLEPYIGGIS